MLEIKKHSGVTTLRVVQNLPISPDEAWKFLSSPHNLKKITPAHMGFNITSDTSGETYPGQIITYKVSPFPFLRLNWVTEITHYFEGRYFVDEQRFGPYSMWHHEHIVEPTENGVNMVDIVTYKAPLGWIGDKFIEPLFIRGAVRKIFEHRFEILEKFFPRQ